ncbi:hypothetical protein LY76DRAFT_163317 [Colletotrichum caudatum]|nr:hypothetical protein LY76DRAFT_163317 [Colletotrichum caudatum]
MCACMYVCITWKPHQEPTALQTVPQCMRGPVLTILLFLFFPLLSGASRWYQGSRAPRVSFLHISFLSSSSSFFRPPGDGRARKSALCSCVIGEGRLTISGLLFPGDGREMW